MSLVQKELLPWGIYVGIPCKRLKERKKGLLELEKQFLKEQIENQ
jgi:acetyltransferase-like isoleucine patch superfamily enzyme